MIVEHAVFAITPGEEAAFERALGDAIPHISSAKGFRSIRMMRGIESPSQYILLVEWETIDDHMEGFRNSEAFAKWRSGLQPFFAHAPELEHFTEVAHKP